MVATYYIYCEQVRKGTLYRKKYTKLQIKKMRGQIKMLVQVLLCKLSSSGCVEAIYQHGRGCPAGIGQLVIDYHYLTSTKTDHTSAEQLDTSHGNRSIPFQNEHVVA